MKRKYPEQIECSKGYIWKLIDPKYGQYCAYYSDGQTPALIDHLPAFGSYKWLMSQV